MNYVKERALYELALKKSEYVDKRNCQKIHSLLFYENLFCPTEEKQELINVQ